MAIQRVGGATSCTNFLVGVYNQVLYARLIVLFVGLLATAIAFCVFRTRTAAGKKLLGLPYLLALLFFIITFALEILTETLQQCNQVNLSSYYNLNIVITVFYGIGIWCLLVVVVWTLNSMLRKRLGRTPKISKIVCLFIVVFMGLFTCVHISLQCYHLWLNTPAGLFSTMPAFVKELTHISLAFWVLYLASVLVSGAFALVAIQSMRSKHVSGGSLQSWIAVLIASLSVWCLISIMQYARQINWEVWEPAVSVTLAWIKESSLVLSLALVIVIARNVVWSRYAEHQSEQYAAGPYTQPVYNY